MSEVLKTNLFRTAGLAPAIKEATRSKWQQVAPRGICVQPRPCDVWLGQGPPETLFDTVNSIARLNISLISGRVLGS